MVNKSCESEFFEVSLKFLRLLIKFHIVYNYYVLLECDIVMTPGHSIACGIQNATTMKSLSHLSHIQRLFFFSHLAFHIGYIFKTKNYFYATLLPEHSQLIQTMITKKNQKSTLQLHSEVIARWQQWWGVV